MRTMIMRTMIMRTITTRAPLRLRGIHPITQGK
jgi:hypothetical protein